MHLKITLAVLLVLLGSTAQARLIRIDQGNNWGESFIADVAGDGSQTVSVGFDLNFGAGLFDSLDINENGFLSFSDGSNITALDVDFASNPLATSVEDVGAISYTQGIFDLSATFTPGDTPDAFRVQWVDQNSAQVMQVLFLDRGDGDFDLELNFGCDDRPLCDDITPIGAGIFAGFDLGPNSVSLTGPFALTDDYTFQFRDGLLVTSVPAPAPLALSLVGLALLGARRYAQRR